MNAVTASRIQPGFILNTAIPHKILPTWNWFEAKVWGIEISDSCVESCTWNGFPRLDLGMSSVGEQTVLIEAYAN